MSIKDTSKMTSFHFTAERLVEKASCGAFGESMSEGAQGWLDLPRTMLTGLCKEQSAGCGRMTCTSRPYMGMTLGTLWWTSFRWGCLSTNHFSRGAPLKFMAIS